MFQQVVHREGESAINYIKIFQNAKDLLISALNGSFEYHLMHEFLENFQKGGNYSAQIETYQA